MTNALAVLLVEDNEVDAEITRRVMAQSGIEFDVQVARDGEEALELLRQPPRPELILLDLRLPGVDGWEVLRRVKNDAHLCVIPVAVLTGVINNNWMMACLELGGNMYFVKPLTKHDVSALLPAIRKYWEIMGELQRRAPRSKNG